MALPKRKVELDQFKAVWLTKKSYSLLREQKGEQRLSMARILDNLIIEKYSN